MLVGCDGCLAVTGKVAGIEWLHALVVSLTVAPDTYQGQKIMCISLILLGCVSGAFASAKAFETYALLV